MIERGEWKFILIKPDHRSPCGVLSGASRIRRCTGNRIWKNRRSQCILKFLINFRQVRNNLKTFRNLQIPNRADCKALRPVQHAAACPARRYPADLPVTLKQRLKLCKHRVEPGCLPICADDETAVSVGSLFPAAFCRLPPFLVADLCGDPEGTLPRSEHRRLPGQCEIRGEDCVLRLHGGPLHLDKDLIPRF